MPAEPAQLQVDVSVPDGGPAELDALTRQLMSELLSLPLESLNRMTAEATPEGAKGGGLAAIGQLAIELSPAVVTLLFQLLRSWVERKRELPVKVTIRVTRRGAHRIEYDPAKTSAEQLRALVAALDKAGTK